MAKGLVHEAPVGASVGSLRARFLKKFDVTPGGCWSWNASCKPNGYGQIQEGPSGGRVLYAHRVAYELFKGAIPGDRVVDHLCRNRRCVNPDHLELVTFDENLLRGDKRAWNLASGEEGGGRTPRGGFTHEATVGASVEWFTPPPVFERLGLHFELDVCAPPGGLPWVPALWSYSREDDGRTAPWVGPWWCNPPYDDVAAWMALCTKWGHLGGVALVFGRTDTAWFHEHAARADAICFIAGRLKFCGPDGKPRPGKDGKMSSAGAGSILVAWGEAQVRALEASGLGYVVRRAV
jgi:hypothetical protein